MVCSVSCGLSLVFLIGMMYFYTMTSKSEIVQKYREQLPTPLKGLYDKISNERRLISYYGYALGFLLSLFLIYFYSNQPKKNKGSWLSVVCSIVATSFVVHYFYYLLSPKSEWMLEHIHSPEQVHAWLQMYRSMQVYYHTGLVLGIFAVGFLAFAFRSSF